MCLFATMSKRKSPMGAAPPPAKRPGRSDSPREDQLCVPDAFASAHIASRARAITATALDDEAATESLFAGASVQFLNEDESSWIYHVPAWYRRVHRAVHSTDAYRAWLAQVWDLHPEDQDKIMMFGRLVPTPRFQQAYERSSGYSGNVFQAKPIPDAIQSAVDMMKSMVPQDAKQSYLTTTLVNWYANGDHYIGPHADDERAIRKLSPVFALSLGAARRFIFTPKKSPAGSNGSRLELLLNDGDLLVMGGRTQQTHKHALPKMKRCQDKRISITMRCYQND